MKKLILFSAILCAVLFMTSCFGEISSNYSDTTFVYIDNDDSGTTYGKTISLYSPTRFITANELILMMPGSFKIMSYKWEENYGKKPIFVDGQSRKADNVRLTDEFIDVDTKGLNMYSLPEGMVSQKFVEIAHPIFANSADFMGDNWLIQYTYDVNKGLTSSVEFYKRDGLDANDNIVIDVYLSHTGTPNGTVVERKTDYIAVNMSSLRSENVGKDSYKVKFVYYLKDRTEQIESQSYTLLLKEN